MMKNFKRKKNESIKKNKKRENEEYMKEIKLKM